MTLVIVLLECPSCGRRVSGRPKTVCNRHTPEVAMRPVADTNPEAGQHPSPRRNHTLVPVGGDCGALAATRTPNTAGTWCPAGRSPSPGRRMPRVAEVYGTRLAFACVHADGADSSWQWVFLTQAKPASGSSSI
jgi:hypothetical protein